MVRLWNAITGKRHWYSVRLVYTTGTRDIFCATRTVGLASQGEILHERQVKKLIVPTIDGQKVKHLFCNGILRLEVVAYLGKFKKPETSTAVTVDWGSIVLNCFISGKHIPS